MAAPTVHDNDCTMRSMYTDKFAVAQKNSTVKDKFKMPKRSKAKRRSQDDFIRPIESEDKEGLSKEPPQAHPCSVPRGSRVGICAPPGHGKSCLAKHIAVYSRPFAAVYVAGLQLYAAKACVPTRHAVSVVVHDQS